MAMVFDSPARVESSPFIVMVFDSEFLLLIATVFDSVFSLFIVFDSDVIIASPRFV